jgi:hypothetical protein
MMKYFLMKRVCFLSGRDEGVQVRHRRNAISSPVENWQALRHLLTKSKRESAMV